MTKIKILKIKVGSAYINGKSVDVFSDAFQKTSKDGKTTYYEIRQPIFVQEIEKQENKEKENVEA